MGTKGSSRREHIYIFPFQQTLEETAEDAQGPQQPWAGDGVAGAGLGVLCWGGRWARIKGGTARASALETRRRSLGDTGAASLGIVSPGAPPPAAGTAAPRPKAPLKASPEPPSPGSTVQVSGETARSGKKSRNVRC